MERDALLRKFGAIMWSRFDPVKEGVGENETSTESRRLFLCVKTHTKSAHFALDFP